MAAGGVMVSKRAATLVACVSVATAGVAHAQVDNTGVLDKALERYRVAAEGWQSAGHAAATTLFWSLAAISLAWTMGQLALRRAELGEFFGELVRYLLFTGFWAWMLNNGPAHAQLIIESMLKLAGGASGQNMMSPSGVLDVGFHLVDRALTQSTILSPLDSAIGIVLALVILVVLALVGVSMLVTLIACWIVAYGGLIVLGFGGSRWTSDMAINYYRMVLSLGLQVLAMVLLVGVGEGFLRSYYAALDQDVSLHEQAVLLVVAIVLLATVNRVPALLGTLVNGSSPQYALGGGPGAGAALTAISTAGGLAAWSSVAGKAAAESGGRLALGAGSLAKAMAAATTAGASAAAASLFDGFRSGGAERASGPTGGTGSGSVFPGTATAASASAAASSTAAVSSQESHPAHPKIARPLAARAQTVGAMSSAELSAKMADAADKGAAAGSPPQAARDPRTADRSSDHREASPRPGSEHARAGAPRGARRAPQHARPDSASSADASSSGHGARDVTEGASRSKRDHVASTAVTDGSGGGTPPPGATGGPTPPAPSTTSPAGTFASAPNSASNAGKIAVQRDPSSASPSPAASPAPAPSQTLASAGRGSASSLDMPFSIPMSQQPQNAPDPPAPAPAAAPDDADRKALPAALSRQTAVDVEAEVAAFRDKE